MEREPRFKPMQSVWLKTLKIDSLQVLQYFLKIPHFDQISDIRLSYLRPLPSSDVHVLFMILEVIVLGRPLGRQGRGLSCPSEPCARPYRNPSYTSK